MLRFPRAQQTGVRVIRLSAPLIPPAGPASPFFGPASRVEEERKCEVHETAEGFTAPAKAEMSERDTQPHGEAEDQPHAEVEEIDAKGTAQDPVPKEEPTWAKMTKHSVGWWVFSCMRTQASSMYIGVYVRVCV